MMLDFLSYILPAVLGAGAVIVVLVNERRLYIKRKRASLRLSKPLGQTRVGIDRRAA